MTTPLPLLDGLVVRLRAAGCVFAEEEAALLLAEAARDGERLERMMRERIRGTPVEHVVGWASFAGLRIPVAPGVFVPRRRTELVARLATAVAPRGGTVVDLCCGSGAIAAAVASARPDLRVVGADIDATAVSLAARTLAQYGATAIESDMDRHLPRSLDGATDVVTACPPYVPTGEIALMPPEARDHEPRTALDGGATGAELQSLVFEAAARLLRPGGMCVVETSEHLVDATLAAASAAGLDPHADRDDALGAVVVVARG